MKQIILLTMLILVLGKTSASKSYQDKNSFYKLMWSNDGNELILANAQQACFYTTMEYVSSQIIDLSINGNVTDIEIDETNDHLIIGNENGLIEIWSISNRRILDSKTFSNNAILDIQLNNDDSLMVVSSSSDRQIEIWDTLTLEHQVDIASNLSMGSTCRLCSEPFRNTTISPNGQFIALRNLEIVPTDTIGVGEARTIWLWNIIQSKGVQVLSYPIGESLTVSYIESIAFSVDSKYLIASTLRGTLMVWDIETGVFGGWYVVHPYSGIYQIELNPDGNTLAVRLYNRLMLLEIELIDNSIVFGDTILSSDNEYAYLAFNPTGEYLATVDFDGMVDVWNIQTGEIEVTLDDCAVDD